MTVLTLSFDHPIKTQEKGDELLRRLLKTPPDPKKGSRDQKATPRKKPPKGNKERTG